MTKNAIMSHRYELSALVMQNKYNASLNIEA